MRLVGITLAGTKKPQTKSNLRNKRENSPSTRRRRVKYRKNPGRLTNN